SKNSAEREAGGERLGDKNYVGPGRKFLVSEVASGAAQTTLNFVGDEESAVLCGKAAGAIPKSFGDRMNAAFALDGFQDDGTYRFVEFGFQVGDVVETDEFHAGHERRKGQAVFFSGGNADCAEGAAVKGVLHRQDAVFGSRLVRSIGGGAGAETRQFQGAVGGFRAAIGEE